MRIVVTGGLGHLGSRVVTALGDLGHDAIVASRRTGVDLLTGAGLAEVLAGADAVVHTADTMRPWEFAQVTTGGTRRVGEAAAEQPRPPHVVYISIVGVDLVPYAYYRAKWAAERELESLGVPATVVRATQFHSLAAAMARAHVGPIGLGVKGFRIQPVDIAWVARRLAEVASGPAPAAFARHPDLTGPELLTAGQIAEVVAGHQGRTIRRRVELPAVGGTLKAFAAGGVLPGSEAEVGGERFTEWLARQPPRLPRR